MRQGGVEGPFLYMLAMLPLMQWIAQEYPQLAETPHTSPAQDYVDDAVPMARDGKAQKVVQNLMQRYGQDNHPVWSTEKWAVVRRGGEGGMARDVGDGVACLDRSEEAVVLGHVQAMEAGGTRLPDKLLRGFRAILVVLRHHLLSVQTTLYYLQALLNAAIRNRGCTSRTAGDSSRRLRGRCRGSSGGMRGYPRRCQDVCCGHQRRVISWECPLRGRCIGRIRRGH